MCPNPEINGSAGRTPMRLKEKGKANAISVHPCPILCLAGTLAVATDDLDPVRRHRGLVIQLECDVLDQERPDFVAESVGIQVTLMVRRNVMLAMLN
jgi:hypothetical protein